MTEPSYRHLADNTPIIVGSGQYVERLHHESSPPFRSALDLAASASQSALQDAGLTASHIDAIAVIRLFSDAAKAWASPFGGSNNPPESIARRIGAQPSRRIYSSIGGTEPLHIMVELMQAIARGELKCALLTGGEAIANQRFALRYGYEADWHEEFDRPLDNREYSKRYASQQEINCGISLPVHYYALIENVQAHQLGHSTAQHQHYMAQLMAPFSEVAATNPFSQSPLAYSTQVLEQIGPENYRISAPYTKRLIAQDAVNQASALLLTSVGQARQLGVPTNQWIFLEAYAEGGDQFLTQRVDLARSSAMEQVLKLTMDSAAATCADMDLIDLYSCFPCAVHAACEALGLPADGTRALTVTGGLPFFGGPGNNYSAHAMAEMATRLRGNPSRALVTANGGFLSSHAAAVMTSEPEHAAHFDWSKEITAVDSSQIPQQPYSDAPLNGAVASFTVISKRDKPDIGIALAETQFGERFLASSTDTEVTSWMQENSSIGRQIDVCSQNGRQIFSFRSD